MLHEAVWMLQEFGWDVGMLRCTDQARWSVVQKTSKQDQIGKKPCNAMSRSLSMSGLLESIDPKSLGDSLSHHRLHHLVSSFPGFHVKKRLAWFSVVNSWLCTQRNFGCRSEMVHFAFNNVQHQIQNFLNLVNIVIPSSSKLKKWNTPKLDNRYPLWQRPNANFRAEKTFATTSVSLKRLGGCLVRQKLSSWERQTLSGNFVQFV